MEEAMRYHSGAPGSGRRCASDTTAPAVASSECDTEAVEAADAGVELAQGLAADREARALRVAQVKNALQRVRRLETWGGKLLTLGGVCFYLLFLLFPLVEFVLSLDLSTRTWGLAFGIDVGAIVSGGFLVFFSQRLQAWLERRALVQSIEV